MAYQHKINWSDPRKGGGVLSFTRDEFKSAVLDLHIQIEGQLEEIRHTAFRDPDMFKGRLEFSRQVRLVRALIGKSPDDEIWEIVNKLAALRNEFAHTTPAPKAIHDHIDALEKQVQKIGPGSIVAAGLYNDKRLDIVVSAHFAVQRFFLEIKDWLGSLPAT
jgi:hypothetical protein